MSESGRSSKGEWSAQLRQTCAQVFSFLKRREIFGFHAAVFAGSSVVGVLSFGPFAILFAPIIFACGYAVALASAAPALYLLMRKGVTSVWAFVATSALSGIFVSFVWAGITAIENWDQDTFVGSFVPFLLLTLPISMAFGLAGFVYWWVVIARERA